MKHIAWFALFAGLVTTSLVVGQDDVPIPAPRAPLPPGISNNVPGFTNQSWPVRT